MESKPLVVVGAGVSGTAAAIEAARAGVRVTLIDENPIGISMMGLDVPSVLRQTDHGHAAQQGRDAGESDCGQLRSGGGGGSRRRGSVGNVCLGRLSQFRN